MSIRCHRQALPLLFSLAVALMSGTPARATDCWDYGEPGFREPVDLSSGYPQAVAARGDHLYVVGMEDSWLATLDASDPAAPVLIDRQPIAAWPFGLHVAGELLLVSQTNPRATAIYSLADPDQPALLATIADVGSRDGLEVIDGLLYASTGEGVRIYDLTEPSAPILAGSFLDGQPSLSLERVGDFLYVAYPGAIGVFALDDPLAPVQVAEVAFSNPSFMLPAGGVLYVASHGRLGSIAIADPAAPLLLTTLDAAFNPEGLALLGHELLYVNNGDIDVHDVSDPAAITELWERPDLWIVKEPCVHEGWLYVPHRRQDGTAVLEVWDAGVPLFPYLDVTDLPGAAGQLAVHDRLGFIAAGRGLMVVDYADPTQPQVLAELEVDPDGGYSKLALGWPHLVLAGPQFEPMYVIDVSDPAQLVVTDIYPAQDTDLVEDLVFRGDHLYVAAGNEGVLAYAVVDGQLELRDVYDSNSYVCYGVEITGDYLLVDFAATLRIFDISDPDDLVWLATVDFPTAAGIEVVDQLLYCFGYSETTIWSVADPTQPVLLGTCPVGGTALTVVGSTAYLAENRDLLHAVDVSDPTAPALIGSLPVEGWATALELVGEHLVLLARHGNGHSWTAWLQCPDVVPTVVTAFAAEVVPGGVRLRWRLSGGYPAAVTLTRIDLAGTRVVPHTQGGDGSYEALDRRRPGDDPGPTYVLSLHGQEVHRESVVIDAPSRPLTVDLAPNPFNPSVEIAYELPRDSTVSVAVFDAAGRRVRGLVSARPQRAGRQTVRWNGRDEAGRDLASGAYLVRVTTEGGVITRKAALLR